MTLNAGAILALITLYGTDHDSIKAAVPVVTWWFLVGLGSSMFSALIAYFYQSFVTQATWDSRNKRFDPEFKEANIDSHKMSRYLAWPMVGLAALSLILFLVGATLTVSEFGKPVPAATETSGP